MNLTLKKLDVLCVVIITMVTLLLGYRVLASGNRYEERVKQERELSDQRFNEFELAEMNLKQLKDLIKVKINELNSFNKMIPESTSMGEFLKSLDAVLEDRGIWLISVNPLSSSRESYFTKTPIRLVCKGSFLSLYQMLYDLENMERIVTMGKMIIERSRTDHECLGEIIVNIFSLEN